MDLLNPVSQTPHEILGVDHATAITQWWERVRRGRIDDCASEEDVAAARRVLHSAAPADKLICSQSLADRRKITSAISHCIGIVCCEVSAERPWA